MRHGKRGEWKSSCFRRKRDLRLKPKYYSERKLLLIKGCNYGDFHRFVMKREKEIGREVYGLYIEVTNHKDNIVKGDAHFLLFKDESFDSIFAGEIIEHQIPLSF